jgi:hypothetical protein
MGMHFNTFMVKKQHFGQTAVNETRKLVNRISNLVCPKYCVFLLEKCWNACQVLFKFFLHNGSKRNEKILDFLPNFLFLVYLVK